MKQYIGLTGAIHKAFTIAARMHGGQMRKDGQTDYIVHPFSVAFRLVQITHDQDLIVAGALHDVPEDTSYSLQMLEKEFNPRVRQIVEAVTEEKHSQIDPKTTWKKRKEADLERMRTCMIESLVLRCVDAINNMESLVFLFSTNGGYIDWSRFNASKEDKFWRWQELFRIIEDRLSKEYPVLVKEYADVFDKLKLCR